MDIVNKRLQAEGKQGINSDERKWLLKNMGVQSESKIKTSTSFNKSPKENNSPSPSSPLRKQIVSQSPNISTNNKKRPIKSKRAYIDQLEQKISMLELNVNEINRRFEKERDEKKILQNQLQESENRNTKLEEENENLKQTKLKLKLKIETSNMNAVERDKSIEELEKKMFSKVLKASERESKMAKKLKIAISEQSKLKSQNIQLHNENINLEIDRKEAINALEKSNALVTKLQKNNCNLSSSKQNLKSKVSHDEKELEEAYKYISLLEESDVRLRTAIALVDKQNKNLSSLNSSLKQQLCDAQATLALHQIYNEVEEDFDEKQNDMYLLASKTSSSEVANAGAASRQNSVNLWDEPEPEPEKTPRELLIPVPPVPPPEISGILTRIPNHVSRRQKRHSNSFKMELEKQESTFEMVDLFAKALLERRNKIVDSDDDDSSDDEWESSEE